MTTWGDVFWKYVVRGCDRCDAAYRADQWESRALAAGSRRAKTPQAVECEASQSGPKGNAHTQGENPHG